MGALFASFMDEQAVETAGLDALGPDLEIVRGVTDAESLARALGTLQATGVAGLLMPFVDNDNEHPDRYSVYLEQAGIGLPDEAYYREAQYAEIRAAYQEHMVRLLELAGVSTPEAVADRAYALEVDLAKHHWDNVSTRDAIKTYNRYTLDELRDVLVDADPFGVEQLATHRVGLDEAATMYDVFQKKQDGCQKVVLKP